MCTLTYVPAADGRILTANRDESPARRAVTLSEHRTSNGETFLIAKEPVHGGTNFAVSTEGEKVAVLLNGGFHRHDMGKTYGKSRGLVVLESLEWRDLFEFGREADLYAVEPFTLFHLDEAIREIRWDGKALHQREHPLDKPFIVASAQLYEPSDRIRRRHWFAEVLATENPDAESIFAFHLNGGDGRPETDMVMNRGPWVRTISISQVVDRRSERRVRHMDLVDEVNHEWDFKR